MTENFDDRRVYWIWLSLLFGAGVSSFWKLCRGYERVSGFAMELAEGRLDGSLTEAQRKKCEMPFSAAAELLDRCRQEGVNVLTYRSTEYPAGLRRISDPPIILYVRGDTSALSKERPAVLMVGTRTPTAGSVRTAERLAGELAERGVTIVTGLENGIDAVAGESASENGMAAAVLGRGIFSDRYAPEQTAKIAASGAVLSEFSGFAEYGRIPFERRNRILCGLARAVVFIECRSDSRGLNNAETARSMNKPVLSVPPADIYDGRFFGQRDLLRSGALPVYSADDVMAALGGRAAEQTVPQTAVSAAEKSAKTAKKVTARQTITKNEQKNVSEGLHKSEMSATIDISGFSEEQKRLWELFDKSDTPIHINRLSEELEMGIPELVQILTELMIEGCITELSGKRYARA
ncbi:MAG: DNA-protecting protein DprA [Ruminococcus sp.]|nr:DNA-protecting protein DprA [Ruminococcus sp.]